jgi:hypothetical protein
MKRKGMMGGRVYFSLPDAAQAALSAGIYAYTRVGFLLVKSGS